LGAIRSAALGVLAAAFLVLAPGAAGAPSITYTITAGTPGNSGWYLSDVTVQLAEPGATGTTCPGVKTFTSSADALDCTATDGTATLTLHLSFKIDKDKPAITAATPDHPPNANGWYNSPVTVTFSGTDGTSGIASCQQAGYGGPDTGGTAVAGTCTDVAGNVSAPASFPLKYDATPPTVTPSPSRGPDANGWYNRGVTVGFSGADALSGVDSCTSSGYSGPDTSGVTVSGTCTDKAGNSAAGSVSIQYDASAPSTSVALDRPPDINGWYNHPVTLNAAGSDGTSGVDSCSSASYSGPDNANASLSDTCTDKAGNSSSASASFKYDSTPPTVTGITVATGNRTARLRWTLSPDTQVAVFRSTNKKGSANPKIYEGTGGALTDTKLTNGVWYHYTLAATDQAGNQATAGADALPLALTSPPQGTTLKKAPLLTWVKVPGASYYNVQMFHAGRKVLSEWPVTTKLKLTKTWKYKGKKYRLKHGRYRWYVWPGYGPRKASKYGKLLGGSFFLVR
jgi:hypothetical protein